YLDAAVALDLATPVTVTDGSATLDKDYRLTEGSLIFPANSTQGSLRLEVVDDNRFELNETAVLTLQSALGISAGASAVHTLTITNNDKKPRVAFMATGQTADEGSTIGVEVKLSGETDEPVTVPLVFQNSTAGPSDYSPAATSITIPPGSRTARFDVAIAD